MFSFSKRKKIVEAAPKLRKLIDLTCPNLPASNEDRSSRRYNRSIPVMLTDWEPGADPTFENYGLGFTTDISDKGFCILTQFVPKQHENILALYTTQDDIKEFWFFHVSFMSYRREPQNYLRIGYSVLEFLNEDFKSITNRLIPKLEELMVVEELATT